MKIYMIILDGAADRKIKELNDLTVLEKANTPNLDVLVSNGAQCMIDVIGDEIIPESDSGAMALLSYSPQQYYPGRGTLEGLGTGCIPNGYSYAAFRVNYGSYNKETGFLDRRTSRGLLDSELQSLSKSIVNNVNLHIYDVDFDLVSFGHHRGILCLYSKNMKLSGNVSNTDPGFEKIGCWGVPVKSNSMIPRKCIPLDNTPESLFTANIINEFVNQANYILENHEINVNRKRKEIMPANCLLIRDGGSHPLEMPRFRDRFDKSLVMYGQLPAEKAIADLIGEKFEYSKSLDLQLDKSFLESLASKIINSKEDVVFVHVKGPDEPGHDNQPLQKIEAVELIDRYFIKIILANMNKDDVVVVTCDHATPCELMLHSSDRVPLLISGIKGVVDSTRKFSESEAENGKLGLTNGVDILPFIMKQLRSRI